MTTRAQVESVLIRRAGALLSAVGKDGSTVDGTNADLNDPLGYAVRQCGGTVASIASVSDSDVASVSDSDVDKLLDIAELRTLESALAGATALVDITVGATSQRYSSIATSLAASLAAKRAALTATYGIMGGSLSAGVIGLDFQTKGDDAFTDV